MRRAASCASAGPKTARWKSATWQTGDEADPDITGFAPGRGVPPERGVDPSRAAVGDAALLARYTKSGTPQHMHGPALAAYQRQLNRFYNSNK